MAAVTLHAPDAMKRVTMTVRMTGVKVLTWRLWLAGHFWKLGARIAGCGIVVDFGKRP